MNTKQTTLGLLVIIAGVLVLLTNLDVGPARNLMSNWWPLFIVAGGLFMLWSNKRNYVWATIVMLIGALLTLKAADIVDLDIGAMIWPLIIVGIGLNLIAESRKTHTRPDTKSEGDISAILGGNASINNSDDYKGTSVNIIMGGVELDISKATIKKEATIHTSVIMGGLELRVPENAVIKNQTTALLGGLEDKTHAVKTKDAPTIYIEGSIIMGGIEIKR